MNITLATEYMKLWCLKNNMSEKKPDVHNGIYNLFVSIQSSEVHNLYMFHFNKPLPTRNVSIFRQIS